jgi:RND family efflux transporter MFP subunit
VRKRRIGWLLLSSPGLALPGCYEGPADAVRPDVAAPVPPSAGSSGAARVAATGRVEGWREADVTSKLPGQIVRFVFDEGDRVEADAAVVQLEDRDLRARVRAAAVRAKETKRRLERVRALREQGVAPASEFDRAESEYLASAAALDEARVMLAYATIEAPFRGTLLRRFKEIGEGVTTSGAPDPLFRIADLSRLKVTAEVPENDIAAIRVGRPAEVTSDAYPGERFAATVLRVGLAVGRKQMRSDDPRERLFDRVIEVELELPGDPRLRSGMTVDIVFPLEAS